MRAGCACSAGICRWYSGQIPFGYAALHARQPRCVRTAWGPATLPACIYISTTARLCGELELRRDSMAGRTCSAGGQLLCACFTVCRLQLLAAASYVCGPGCRFVVHLVCTAGGLGLQWLVQSRMQWLVQSRMGTACPCIRSAASCGSAVGQQLCTSSIHMCGMYVFVCATASWTGASCVTCLC